MLVCCHGTKENNFFCFGSRFHLLASDLCCKGFLLLASTLRDFWSFWTIVVARGLRDTLRNRLVVWLSSWYKRAASATCVR